MIRTTSTILLLALFKATAVAQPQATRPAQIILFRHAEKPADPKNPHLAPAGVKRAQQLVSFIATDPAMTRFGPPVTVFATKTTNDGDGQRTQETVAPLASALKLTVETPYVGKDFAKLAKLILANPAYAKKTVLVCWNHEEIPQLAAALGVTPAPPKWKGSVYDLVYVISYRAGAAELTTSRYASP